ncbi:pyridoxal phosphate enzyme (YggS family) [Lachnospiraceae bacterium PF1-21]|uniref:Pyridoxal phosphate homeostasis protein n=1 Tax=Ohessyouella blattaphilus TaxID=2949333 RepID=A0ABT1EEW0_9FIRM|nr:YggS family pyridoxal phosphate-dependent enzyme [Ohessyouella blattaphilus]MCP1109218.1 YggS family pyridoxal phosphate-dependent enzyme [Ohessyouella blattaphilus]MCR8562612.1 YggS family pyridoxal phosphate-dependent enzyme [Ohessyouella blattaphilus]
MINENLKAVQEKIAKAAEKAGRNLEEITLIAVSKTKPIPVVKSVYDLGVRDFGENKVQELDDKSERLPGDIRWHMIGHLQRNKVKYIVDKVALIHSVESLRLAETIDKEAKKKGVVVPILIEVNVAGEESKFGLKPEETLPFVKSLQSFTNIEVKGLMTIAPYVSDPEENRPVFATLRKLLVDIKEENLDNVNVSILSMGMSNDYQIAIEEGATMVRVGTEIFGERNYA